MSYTNLPMGKVLNSIEALITKISFACMEEHRELLSVAWYRYIDCTGLAVWNEEVGLIG